MGPGVGVGYPLQTIVLEKQRTMYLGDSAEGTITRSNGPMEATPVEVSSTERMPSQTIE